MSIEILTKRDLQLFGNDLIKQLQSNLKVGTPREYCTKKEALELLQCSERQLEVLRGSRKIGFTRIGKEFQYQIKSVNDLLNSKLINVIQ